MLTNYNKIFFKIGLIYYTHKTNTASKACEMFLIFVGNDFNISRHIFIGFI